MKKKDEFVSKLGENKRKGWIKLGFSAKEGGVESREGVVAHLDEEQRKWQESCPNHVPTEVREEIRMVVHRGIGCTAWYGFRHFYPIQKTEAA